MSHYLNGIGKHVIVTMWSCQYQGHTHVHQQPWYNDAAPILGEGTAIQAANQDAICETKSHDQKLHKMQHVEKAFWGEMYPYSYAVVMYVLTQANLSNPAWQVLS